jgi:zinc/manganese transport system permease protein
MTSVLALGYQPDWVTVLQAGFMRNAFLAGSIVAVAAGLIGYFVVVRRTAFAAHALAHIGFPGATGAVLLGLPVTLGLAVFTTAGALAIGLLGKRAAEREVATGTVLAFATGLGVLFGSLATQSAATVTNVLFGNLLAITHGQLVVFAGFVLLLLAVLAATARPLLFASVDPQVAEARGLPVRALGMLFLLLMALVVTMAVQVVGTLLLFGLVVTPAATALLASARPGVVVTLSSAVALVSVWLGLVLAAMFNVPPSFVIISVATALWLLTMGWTRLGRSSERASRVPGGVAKSPVVTVGQG